MQIPLKPRPSKAARKRQRERLFAVISLVVIAAAWIIGGLRAEADLVPALQQAFPEAGHIERLDTSIYGAYQDDSQTELLGYIALAEAKGYGGPLVLAVAVDPAATVTGVVVANHKETPAWMDKVANARYMDDLVSKSYSDSFRIGEDLDGVTGATYTAAALAEAALLGSQAVARYLDLSLTTEPAPLDINFGIPEITLIALFAAGYLTQQRKFKYKKQVRWATLLAGMVLLGFLYNKPLTLSMINQALLGYFPHWQTNLYWFLLIGGILFVFTVDNKNPYCEFFCPFGAAQECMGIIGGAKARSIGKTREIWTWVHRALAWLAIVIALVYRNPGLTSYEIFGTLFKLVGSNYQFILTGLVLVVALFVKRPWCNYLCPLHPVEEFVRVIRRWIKEIWKSKKPSASLKSS